MVRRFLIAFKELDIDAAAVKSGFNARNVVVACRCINVGLFLSGNIRRDVEVSISIGKQEAMKVITFPGSTLKRVSPDERSIAFFLLKAYNTLEDMQLHSKRTMNNGIVLQKMPLRELFDSWTIEKYYVANQQFDADSDFSTISEAGLYIYDTVPNNLELKDYVMKSLSRPPHPERFILEINLKCDSQV